MVPPRVPTTHKDQSNVKRQDFRFFHPLRVRWVEVDMQKIVFNAHYLMYFDTGMADYWRALAVPYEEAMHMLGGDLYVKKASMEYFDAARFDDTLHIALKCVRVGHSSIEFAGAVFRGEALLVKSELVYVFADPATRKSQGVPDALRELLRVYEDGGVVHVLKTGTWAELGADAAQLRMEVFVREQGVPIELEWDEADSQAIHAVLYNRLGQVLATGRLLANSLEAVGSGKVGRMAVKRVVRGSGMGRHILDALTAEARRRGDSELVLHAQLSAKGFYERAGFCSRGDVFDEVDIAHVEMFKTLI